MNVEELAEKHWEYVSDVLRTHGETEDVIDACGFHYVTAFIHGYKHAMEEVTSNSTNDIGAWEDYVADVDVPSDQPVVGPEAVYGGGS